MADIIWRGIASLATLLSRSRVAARIAGVFVAGQAEIVNCHSRISQILEISLMHRSQEVRDQVVAGNFRNLRMNLPVGGHEANLIACHAATRVIRIDRFPVGKIDVRSPFRAQTRAVRLDHGTRHERQIDFRKRFRANDSALAGNDLYEAFLLQPVKSMIDRLLIIAGIWSAFSFRRDPPSPREIV